MTHGLHSSSATCCHRCGAALPAEPDGTLAFCAHCGAPQVWLSEELRDRAEALATAETSETPGSAALAPQPESSTAPDWSGAIRCAALAAAIAAGLTLVSLAVPPVLLLTWLWIVASPVVVLGIYHSRYPQTRLTAGIGAKVGLLTGFFVVVVMGILNTSALVITRHMHAMGDFDARLSAMMQQAAAQAQATAGGADNPLAQQLAVPEFRVGMLLAGVAMAVFLLLTLTAMGGAFAGLMRSKPVATPNT